MLTVTNGWREAFPGAVVGVLAMSEVTNPDRHGALEQRKSELEDSLREQYAEHDRSALRALPVLEAYDRFYRRFRKTYHLQLQLESVALKGKEIPSVAALVECMFMAELQDLVLTAGHDLQVVQSPIELCASQGDEQFERMNGQMQQLKAGDMYIADDGGILSSVIYGPDRRTRITASTEQALFTAYAPRGVGPDLVQAHLEHIREYVQLVSPKAATLALEIHQAQPDP